MEKKIKMGRISEEASVGKWHLQGFTIFILQETFSVTEVNIGRFTPEMA